jgi:hypothetical protein
VSPNQCHLQHSDGEGDFFQCSIFIHAYKYINHIQHYLPPLFRRGRLLPVIIFLALPKVQREITIQPVRHDDQRVHISFLESCPLCSTGLPVWTVASIKKSVPPLVTITASHGRTTNSPQQLRSC